MTVFVPQAAAMAVENAIGTILNAAPPFRKYHIPIEHEPVGKEKDSQYVERTLSYLLVPVIAVSLLGTVDAIQFFPALPITGASAHSLMTRSAQFSFHEIVHAVRTLLLTSVPILLSDIMHDPREAATGSLYFSERLQNRLLDGILHLYPQLYQSIRQWLHTRYEQEKHHWELRKRGALQHWNPSRSGVLNPAFAILDPYAQHMPLPAEVVADDCCMPSYLLPSPVTVPTNMSKILRSTTARANRILKSKT
jgi:hypothetical protein